DFGSRDADDLCDLVHAGVRDVAFGVLHLPQQGHQRAAATLERVPADDLLQALRLVVEEGYDGVELYHLSTSPSTGSKLAMLMTMSANNPPRLEGSSDCRLARLGARTLTRYGIEPPSLTM